MPVNYKINYKCMKVKRISFGYTQTELAKLIGINQTVISDMEIGKSVPRPKTLKKLCDELQIDIMTIIS